MHDPKSDDWVIGLEPESGVSITHPKALETLRLAESSTSWRRMEADKP